MKTTGGRRPSFVDQPASSAVVDRVLGVCPEAADLLRGKPVSIEALCALRVLMPPLQVELARSMADMDLYTASHARAVVAIAPDEGLVNRLSRHGRAISEAKLATMRRKWEALERQLESAKARYRDDAIDLVLIRGFLDRLLSNARIVRYLARHRAEALRTFQDVLDPAINADGGADMKPASIRSGAARSPDHRPRTGR